MASNSNDDKHLTNEIINSIVTRCYQKQSKLFVKEYLIPFLGIELEPDAMALLVKKYQSQVSKITSTISQSEQIIKRKKEMGGGRASIEKDEKRLASYLKRLFDPSSMMSPTDELVSTSDSVVSSLPTSVLSFPPDNPVYNSPSDVSSLSTLVSSSSTSVSLSPSTYTSVTSSLPTSSVSSSVSSTPFSSFNPELQLKLSLQEQMSKMSEHEKLTDEELNTLKKIHSDDQAKMKKINVEKDKLETLKKNQERDLDSFVEVCIVSKQKGNPNPEERCLETADEQEEMIREQKETVTTQGQITLEEEMTIGEEKEFVAISNEDKGSLSVVHEQEEEITIMSNREEEDEIMIEIDNAEDVSKQKGNPNPEERCLETADDQEEIIREQKETVTTQGRITLEEEMTIGEEKEFVAISNEDEGSLSLVHEQEEEITIMSNREEEEIMIEINNAEDGEVVPICSDSSPVNTISYGKLHARFTELGCKKKLVEELFALFNVQLVGEQRDEMRKKWTQTFGRHFFELNKRTMELKRAKRHKSKSVEKFQKALDTYKAKVFDPLPVLHSQAKPPTLETVLRLDHKEVLRLREQMEKLENELRTHKEISTELTQANKKLREDLRIANEKVEKLTEQKKNIQNRANTKRMQAMREARRREEMKIDVGVGDNPVDPGRDECLEMKKKEKKITNQAYFIKGQLDKFKKEKDLMNGINDDLQYEIYKLKRQLSPEDQKSVEAETLKYLEKQGIDSNTYRRYANTIRLSIFQRVLLEKEVSSNSNVSETITSKEIPELPSLTAVSNIVDGDSSIINKKVQPLNVVKPSAKEGCDSASGRKKGVKIAKKAVAEEQNITNVKRKKLKRKRADAIDAATNNHNVKLVSVENSHCVTKENVVVEAVSSAEVSSGWQLVLDETLGI